jgi:hypothetical protein
LRPPKGSWTGHETRYLVISLITGVVILAASAILLLMAC